MKWRFYPIKLYFASLPVAVFTGISAILNVFSWVWLWIQIPRTGDQGFLHYNILCGVDQVGESWKIFYVPLLGLLIFLINLCLGWVLYRTDKFMAQTLLFFAALCQVFVVIATFLLIFLNV